MEKITFLHISDLHIATVPDLAEMHRRPRREYLSTVAHGHYAASYNLGRLEALVDLVFTLKHRLNAVVITGDIATTGFTDDLKLALRFVEGRPDKGDQRLSKGFPTLGGTRLPVFLLPGNHDRYRMFLGRLGFAPGGRKFHDIFRRHWADDVKVNLLKTGNFALAIVAADFSLRSKFDSQWPNIPLNMYAQGRVYPDALQKLVTDTAAFVERQTEIGQDIAVVWAVHFPPLAPNLPDYMQLLEGDKLLSAAADAGALLILSGHTHYPFELKSPNVVPLLLGAGTATQYDAPEGNHCQIVSIENSDGDCVVDVEHYLFDRQRGRFAPAEEGAAFVQ